ncbi:hypothetical protein [Paramicrobacterium humi]|uniref:hypothetical protein n=1 Tax=Paramicrobacterium humi TaxID=640635 RepID=UPI00115FCA0F|nr:hypothetical protein [Microbacterium humi]
MAEETAPEAASEDRSTVTATRDPLIAAGGSVPMTDASTIPTSAEPQPSLEPAGAPVPTDEELAYRGWFSDAVSWVGDKVEDAADAVVDEVKEHADDAVVWGTGKLGGILGAFGGPVGAAAGAQLGTYAGKQLTGLFRGQDGSPVVMDAQTARALDQSRNEQAQLRAITREVTQRLAPILADAMYQESQARNARGEDGPADDEAIERFWADDLFKQITSTIMTDCLQPAIKTVTQSLGMFADSRDMDTIDPVLVDTEVAHKFTAPVLGAVIAAVQSCVPDFYAYIRTGSAPTVPRDASITWDDLISGGRLFDGDRIAVLEPTPLDDQRATEFVIEVPKHKSWFKGLQLLDESGTPILELSVDGVDRSDSGRVASESFLASGCIMQLLKSDASGLRRVAYRLPTATLTELQGQSVHFYWYAG